MFPFASFIPRMFCFFFFFFFYYYYFLFFFLFFFFCFCSSSSLLLLLLILSLVVVQLQPSPITSQYGLQTDLPLARPQHPIRLQTAYFEVSLRFSFLQIDPLTDN